MICCYLRSSSINTFDMCEHKYFLEYVLGFKFPANISAEKGSVIHKVLEVLALAKKAQQNDEDCFNDEHFGLMKVDSTPKEILNLAYEFFKNESTHTWTNKDFKDCTNWLDKIIYYNNGMFDPRKLNIFAVEQYFDIEIDEDWAEYEYKLENGNVIKGKLAIKGTIDLITQINDNTLEIVDWKTGRRWNWAKNKEKNWKDLEVDNQLLLYHYAAKKLFPQFEDIFMTIVWIKDGGAYSFCYDNNTVALTRKVIKKYFDNIRQVNKPRLNIKSHCNFCQFAKNTMPNSKINICKGINKELYNIGIDATVQKYSKESFSSYGVGASRSR